MTGFTLKKKFGPHESAIGVVSESEKSIIFDGIKYGVADRFEKATAAQLPISNDFSTPGFSCPTASNVLTGSLTLPRSTPENEDCLYLQVVAPTRIVSKLAVSLIY